MTYKPFSLVSVPFPFTDKNQTKRRPALVLSQIHHQKKNGHITLLMITSAKNSTWESDHLMSTLENTGLSAPSIIRQKSFRNLNYTP
jgi:mRNA interferase MazF